MSSLGNVDPAIANIVSRERTRQHDTIELIASENFTSAAVMEAMGTVLTNKYAEGYPGRRYYGGCDVVDEAEILAIDRAKELFGARYANVQPHSGAQANMATMFTLLEPGDRILGMNLQEGGHLTHGFKINFSGRLYDASTYGVDPDTELIDFGRVRDAAREFRPKLIISGASAYSRTIDFARFREIADEVGAWLIADIAHIAGIIAAGMHPTSVDVAHITTTTTHKTLRGPRGGLILTDDELGPQIDKTVFPGIQGGPLMHVIAAKAVAFHEALQPSFKNYIHHVLENAGILSEALQAHGMRIVSGGTDNHLMLVDLTDIGISGRKAERVLDEAGITLNKNTIPNDTRSPMQASGVRIGTSAMTTRGFGVDEMRKVAELIARVLTNVDDKATVETVRSESQELARAFPVPGVAD